jgi:hypothetical protein
VVERLFADLIDGPLLERRPTSTHSGVAGSSSGALASALAGCAIARRNSADAYRLTLPVVE